MGKLDISFFKRNIDNKGYVSQKDIDLINKAKDSSDLITTNFISKKVKDENKIKDLNLKNEKNKKYIITKDNIIRKCKNLLLVYIRKFLYLLSV